MAEKRMFAKTVIDSDTFLDMPLSAQALYFHLSMRADDDGFINSPKKVQRMIGASEDDLKLLIAKKFILAFDSGIVVIKHWKMHNYIQSDRYKPTVYEEEKALLSIKNNRAYTLNKPVNDADASSLDTECIQTGYNMDTECIQDVSSLDTQIRLDKYRLDKYRLDKNKEEEDVYKPIDIGEPEKEQASSSSSDEISEELSKVFRTYSRCGFDITGYTKDELETLSEEYSPEWVIGAIERAADRGNLTMGYVKGILSDWKKHGAMDDGKPKEPTLEQQTEKRKDNERKRKEIEDRLERAFLAGEIG